MARKKCKGTELSVFKGREARLNRSIIQALAAREPQTTRELRKRITQTKGMKHTRYSTVNKRVRKLEQSSYLRKTMVQERVGGIANFYELCPKAYLATFLNSTNLECLIDKATDGVALAILATMIGAGESILE